MQGFSVQLPMPPQVAPADRAVQSLESRLRVAGSAAPNARREELRRAAEEFESLFVAYLLKVMRETLDEAGSSEAAGFGKAIYTEIFDQEVSRMVARRGALGIADVIMRGMPEETPKSDGRSPSAPGPTVTPTPSPGDVKPSEIPDTLMPVQSPVSSGFGFRQDPFTREMKFHKGLDLAAPEGTAVQAVSDGEVAFAGHRPGYGNLVVLRHSGGLETRYAHLGRISVRTGDSIRSDQPLGEVGASGRATGPHLHFEVVRWGVNVDPRQALAEARALHRNSPAGRGPGSDTAD